MSQLNPSSINETQPYLKPAHAYVCLAVCYNLNFILLHFSAVAPFAPVIGLAAGCAGIYMFSNGYR